MRCPFLSDEGTVPFGGKRQYRRGCVKRNDFLRFYREKEVQNVCARNDVVIKVQSHRFLYVHKHFVVVYEINMLAENCIL